MRVYSLSPSHIDFWSITSWLRRNGILCVRAFPSLISTSRHYPDSTRGRSRPQGLVASLLAPESEDHRKARHSRLWQAASYTTPSWRMNAWGMQDAHPTELNPRVRRSWYCSPCLIQATGDSVPNRTYRSCKKRSVSNSVAVEGLWGYICGAPSRKLCKTAAAR